MSRGRMNRADMSIVNPTEECRAPAGYAPQCSALPSLKKLYIKLRLTVKTI